MVPLFVWLALVHNAVAGNVVTVCPAQGAVGKLVSSQSSLELP